MEKVKQLLQVSAKLYQHLSNIPMGEDRDRFIEEINIQLDKRGGIINALREEQFIIDPSNKSHETLMELDKGIKERLENVMKSIKIDMKDLQNAKKNEHQYMNPYADVRVMDGMYYDKKK